MAPPTWAGTHCPSTDGTIPPDPTDYVFFLSRDEVPHGCFSNAFREEYGHRDASGAKFWCINQELHYRKAVLFGDDDVASQILAEENDASKIKQLGRMVKGYDDGRWCEVRYGVCRDALYAKFSQNPELKEILLGTGTKVIVEAAKDKVWGIGCVEFSSSMDGIVGAKNRETGTWDKGPNEWEGQNLLGRCLMDVRKELFEER